MDDAHAPVRAAVVAPKLCGGVDIAVPEVSVIGARADVVADLGGGERVGAEAGARVAEAVAAEAGDERAGGRGSARPDVGGRLGVDGEEGDRKLCLG